MKNIQIVSVQQDHSKADSHLNIITASDMTKLFCYGDQLSNLDAEVLKQFPILKKGHRVALADYINKELVLHLQDKELDNEKDNNS